MIPRGFMRSERALSVSNVTIKQNAQRSKVVSNVKIKQIIVSYPRAKGESVTDPDLQIRGRWGGGWRLAVSRKNFFWPFGPLF